VLLGTWAAGIEVAYQSWATAGLGEPRRAADAAFVSTSRLNSFLEDPPVAKHRFVLGLARHGGPTPSVPDGYRDFLAELRPYADARPPRIAAGVDDAATVDGTTYGAWREIAAAVAQRQGIGPGDRVLIPAERYEEPVQWLLAPLVAGASIVLCANTDPGAMKARAAAENVTRVLS
jgi:hypothetical protein